MAQFIFSGDPRAPGTDPVALDMYGILFTFLTPVDVEDDEIAAKLRRHSHFTEVPGKPTGGLKAEHHGGGRFNITRGEEVIARGLTKADADAFTALSEEEKREYVKDL